MAEERAFKGDTAILEAYLYDEDGVTPLHADTISWIIKRPDGETDTGGPLSVDDTEAAVVYNNTDLPGLYTAQIIFTLPNGNKKSVVRTFEIIDPLETSDESLTPIDAAVDRAWMKLEDLFDSELGGPWLRDATELNFDRTKLRRFVPDALYTIGATYQPVVTYSEDNFPYEAHTPLLAQALLVEAIYHLIRSYVEQKLPAGPNVGYFDRRDYLQRWQSVLTLEEQKLTGWLDLFKKELMGYGSTATILGGYSNIYGRAPRYMRGRYPFIHTRW